jgi:cytochrome bd ubiquinol oxidase subunit I
MMYPVWEVPVLGSGWIIGMTAILHVFISHFAIGGGAFLAFTEQLAYKNKDERLYDWLKGHSKFFLLVTTVLGVVSGVGIWWATGLASPNGISMLLQNFSLFWAIEYLFFLAELVVFYAWYYTQGRMDKKTHLSIAWTYFAISIFTLFVINGILTFMLTSGVWPQTHQLADAFFNPGFWPAFFLRLFIMFALAGVYAFLTGSRIKDPELKTQVLQYSSKWMLPALMMGPVFIVWYLFVLPPATQAVIINGLSTIGQGNFSLMARTVVLTIITAASLLLLTLVGPFLNARKFSFTFAIFIFLSAFTFMMGEEWSREMMRKPYVVYNYMYSNGLRKDMVANVNEKGFFNTAVWANAELQAAHEPNDLAKGKLMFRYQCMSCHNPTGYRSMERLLGERDEEAIGSLLEVVSKAQEKDNPYHGYMAPLVGTKDEKAALAKYLVTLSVPYKEAQLARAKKEDVAMVIKEVKKVN